MSPNRLAFIYFHFKEIKRFQDCCSTTRLRSKGLQAAECVFKMLKNSLTCWSLSSHEPTLPNEAVSASTWAATAVYEASWA